VSPEKADSVGAMLDIKLPSSQIFLVVFAPELAAITCKPSDTPNTSRVCGAAKP
jgi:hypothetical protein